MMRNTNEGYVSPTRRPDLPLATAVADTRNSLPCHRDDAARDREGGDGEGGEGGDGDHYDGGKIVLYLLIIGILGWNWDEGYQLGFIPSSCHPKPRPTTPTVFLMT